MLSHNHVLGLRALGCMVLERGASLSPGRAKAPGTGRAR